MNARLKRKSIVSWKLCIFINYWSHLKSVSILAKRQKGWSFVFGLKSSLLNKWEGLDKIMIIIKSFFPKFSALEDTGGKSFKKDCVEDTGGRNHLKSLWTVCTPVFTAALLTTAKRWKQPKCTSLDVLDVKGVMSTQWDASQPWRKEVPAHAVTGTNLENSTVSEINHTWKDKHCMIALAWGTRVAKLIEAERATESAATREEVGTGTSWLMVQGFSLGWWKRSGGGWWGWSHSLVTVLSATEQGT